MRVEPQPEHQWLKRLLGEWTYETESTHSPERFSGSETVRAIGELWVVAQGQGIMPGAGDVTFMMTLGFDPQKNRFTGTWFGSMMAELWVYDGWKEGENKLVLQADGPSFSGDGTTSTYRDTIELQGNDQRTLTASVLGADGQWTTFMTTRYRRRG